MTFFFFPFFSFFLVSDSPRVFFQVCESGGDDRDDRAIAAGELFSRNVWDGLLVSRAGLKVSVSSGACEEDGWLCQETSISHRIPVDAVILNIHIWCYSFRRQFTFYCYIILTFELTFLKRPMISRGTYQRQCKFAFRTVRKVSFKDFLYTYVKREIYIYTSKVRYYRIQIFSKERSIRIGIL